MKVVNGFFICLCLCSLVMSGNVNAANYENTNFEIVSVMPSTKGIHLNLSVVSGTGPECTSSWHGNQFLIEKNTANYNGLSAAILSAFVSGKQITKVHYNILGNGDCSHNNEISVWAFKIIK